MNSVLGIFGDGLHMMTSGSFNSDVELGGTRAGVGLEASDGDVNVRSNSETLEPTLWTAAVDDGSVAGPGCARGAEDALETRRLPATRLETGAPVLEEMKAQFYLNQNEKVDALVPQMQADGKQRRERRPGRRGWRCRRVELARDEPAVPGRKKQHVRKGGERRRNGARVA
jgi:hypothetical protein